MSLPPLKKIPSASLPALGAGLLLSGLSSCSVREPLSSTPGIESTNTPAEYQPAEIAPAVDPTWY